MNRTILERPVFDELIRRMATEIRLAYRGQELPVLIGIRTRGATLAVRIAKEMKRYSGVSQIVVGFCDISFYRDDLSKIADRPVLRGAPTELPLNISLKDKSVLLIDDVLYTGRTTKAALDAIMEQERPREVKLAVLIDRGHRELPIEANFVGKKIPTTDTEVIHVHCKEDDGVDNVEISDNYGPSPLIDFQGIYCIKHRQLLRECGCQHDVYGIKI